MLQDRCFHESLVPTKPKSVNRSAAITLNKVQTQESEFDGHVPRQVKYLPTKDCFSKGASKSLVGAFYSKRIHLQHERSIGARMPDKGHPSQEQGDS